VRGKGASTRARARDGECAESYGRAAAPPCGPSPAPAPSTASPPGGALPRVACEMWRTRSVALAAAGVISGRTSASGRPYVPSSRRLIRSPGRLRAEGCGWDDAVWSARSVERTARRRARSCSSKAQRAAAAVHVVHGKWWSAAGGERAAGRRLSTSARDQVQGPPCTGRGAELLGASHASGVQEAKGSACAECEMRRRRAAGRRRRTSARHPRTRAALHALSVASRAYGGRASRTKNREVVTEVQVLILISGFVT